MIRVQLGFSGSPRTQGSVLKIECSRVHADPMRAAGVALFMHSSLPLQGHRVPARQDVCKLPCAALGQNVALTLPERRNRHGRILADGSSLTCGRLAFGKIVVLELLRSSNGCATRFPCCQCSGTARWASRHGDVQWSPWGSRPLTGQVKILPPQNERRWRSEVKGDARHALTSTLSRTVGGPAGNHSGMHRAACRPWAAGVPSAGLLRHAREALRPTRKGPKSEASEALVRAQAVAIFGKTEGECAQRCTGQDTGQAPEARLSARVLVLPWRAEVELGKVLSDAIKYEVLNTYRRFKGLE